MQNSPRAGWPRALLLAALALALMAGLFASAATAQTQPPAPTAPAITPTATLTGPELIGVGEQADRWQEILVRYGFWGGLGIVLVAAALYLLSGYGEGIREAFKERAKRTFGRPFEAADQRRAAQEAARAREDDDTKARRAYLEWLQHELHYLPQIPLKQDQPDLALSDVYVPLRVVERQQIDRFYAYMLGEHGDGGEYRARREALGAIEASQRVYRLLSDRDCLPPPEREPAAPQRAQRLTAGPAEEPPEEPLTHRLLLVGDAGSGKTTTLYYGALMLARDCAAGNSLLARSELGLHAHERPIPIYVRLSWVLSDLRGARRELAAPVPGASAEHVIDFLDRYLRGQVGEILPTGAVSGWLAAGGCLVMLDGLDETGDAAERSYAKELVANLVQYRPNNRYIVASRPFEGVGLGLPGFLERRLSPLDEGEIRRLIEQWFGAAGRGERSRRPRNIQQQIDELWGRLQASPRLFDMATNPLLLTSMAILVYGGDPLPPVRAQIYYELTRLTINRWREAQLQAGRLEESGAHPRHPDERVRLYADESNDEVRRRLQTLAAAMLRLRRREVRLREAQEILAPIYEQEQGWPRQKSHDHVQALLYLLALHSGLIQERDQGYSFVHFTLQEYLAARDYDERDDLDGLLAQWSEPRWREALLLAVGHWATDGLAQRAAQLLTQLLDLHDNEALMLAAEALDEAAARSVTSLRNPLDATVRRLRALAFDPAACPDPAVRARAAGLLDRLGADDRPALDPADPAFWAARIEPGAFEMGERGEAFIYHVRQPYALARFPVTNRLYLRFLEALEMRGEEGRAEAERRRPRYWPGPRYAAGEGAHPVVGVSWEDACAFAAWASETFLSAEQRAAGEQIRLPTEPEWERAAAYPLLVPPGQPGLGRRDYPWGAWPEPLTDTADDSIKGSIRANTHESGLGSTTPVGIFPHGAAACGAEELAGNVWEWCATSYQAYPLPDDLQPETIDSYDRNRTYVLRGGSWYDLRAIARCGARVHYFPVIHFDGFGFRVARLFSLPSS